MNKEDPEDSGNLRTAGRIDFRGGGFMCRKNCMIGVGLMCLGIGILGGFCLGSWFLCACSSLSLIALGFLILRKH